MARNRVRVAWAALALAVACLVLLAVCLDDRAWLAALGICLIAACMPLGVRR